MFIKANKVKSIICKMLTQILTVIKIVDLNYVDYVYVTKPKLRSQPTQYRYTVKDCVQSCRFSQNEQKNDNRVFIFHTVSLFLYIFYISDDVQAI